MQRLRESPEWSWTQSKLPDLRRDSSALELAPVDDLEAKLLRATDEAWHNYAVEVGLIEATPGGYAPTDDPAILAWMREREAMRDADG